MSTLTTVRTGTAVRVNLLPPEIFEEARFRRTRSGLALAVVASVALVAWLFFLAVNDASDAQEQLDVAVAREATLTAEATEYAEVPLVNAQLDAAKAQLALAMGQEVRWSFYLNDLSLRIPGHVWLKTVHGQIDKPAATPAAPGVLEPGLGSVTFAGSGYRHNDLATWLEVLAKQKGYASPYFSSSKDAKIGESELVDFESSAVLTEEALSERYTIGTQEDGR
jgi:Tfp pilus assembly protein PilN